MPRNVRARMGAPSHPACLLAVCVNATDAHLNATDAHHEYGKAMLPHARGGDSTQYTRKKKIARLLTPDKSVRKKSSGRAATQQDEQGAPQVIAHFQNFLSDTGLGWYKTCGTIGALCQAINMYKCSRSLAESTRTTGHWLGLFCDQYDIDQGTVFQVLSYGPLRSEHEVCIVPT